MTDANPIQPADKKKTQNQIQLGRHILGGAFELVKEIEVECSKCRKIFKHPHSAYTSLTYRLKNKHPFTYHETVSKQSKEAMYVAMSRQIAKGQRPINIDGDEGLQELLKIATGSFIFLFYFLFLYFVFFSNCCIVMLRYNINRINKMEIKSHLPYINYFF